MWPWSRRPEQKRPAIGDPFAVVPIPAEGVEVRFDSRGLVRLRRCDKPVGLRRRLADWLGYDYSLKVALDEYGTFYFKLIDGRTPLRAIADRMAERWQRGRKETDDGVILFTKKLMVMNMIVLKVPAPNGGETA